MLAKQINLIEDKNIRKDVEYIMGVEVPMYFFEVPASSTGKYHPTFSLGEGGLVRHTKAAVKIATELFEIEEFAQFEKDRIIAALILHDSMKHGASYNGYTQFEHPIYAAQLVLKCYEEGKLNMGQQSARTIAELIACHMGKWNTNKYSFVELPKPETRLQKFVHMCDFLASRKFLDIKFNEENEIDEN